MYVDLDIFQSPRPYLTLPQGCVYYKVDEGVMIEFLFLSRIKIVAKHFVLWCESMR